MKALPCAVSRCSNAPSDCAHVKTRAAGGTHRDTIPLCRIHHVEQGNIGIKTFAERYNLGDLEALAKHFADRWEKFVRQRPWIMSESDLPF